MALFTTDEYRSRVSRVRQAMSVAEVDVAIVSEAANMAYLTGYMETAYYHKTFVVISVDEEDPYWIGRATCNAPAARLTSYLPEERLLTYGEEYATHSPDALGTDPGGAPGDAMTFVGEVFEERGWATKTVGVEFASRLFPHSYGLSIRENLPNATFEDITCLVDRCRIVKSPAEIALMREAGVIAERSLKRCLDDIQPGARECDVVANIFQSLVSGTPEFGGFYPEGVLFNVGPRLPAIHGFWTDGPIAPNELINVEMGATRYGYNVGVTRSAVIGKVSPDLERLIDLVHQAFEDMLPVAVAGNTCADLAQAFARRLDENNVRYRPWMGYGIGLGLPSQGWVEPIGIRRTDTTVLEPNMTFHQVPIFWLDEMGGWFLVASETFRITEAGPPELLTSMDRILFHK